MVIDDRQHFVAKPITQVDRQIDGSFLGDPARDQDGVLGIGRRVLPPRRQVTGLAERAFSLGVM